MKMDDWSVLWQLEFDGGLIIRIVAPSKEMVDVVKDVQ